MAIVHSSYYRPRIIPVDADVDPVEIDRLQELSTSTTLNREKIEEIGRDGVVDFRKGVPDISLTARQLEYGSLEFFKKLANKGDSVTQVSFSDMHTPRFDIAGYKTDNAGTFMGTIWYPNLRTSSFSLNIGDPDALIERNFTFVGEDEIILRQNGKYLITSRHNLTGGSNQTITLNDPSPVADPDNSGEYLFKVVRVRSGTATILTHGIDWSYNGSGTLTINGTSVAGDIIKVWYSAASYVAGQNPFVNNDSDLAGISADSCSIYLVTNSLVTRLQSVSMEVSFDRFDVREIGNKDTVQFGVRDTTVRVTLGRIIENYTIEEILRGKAGTDYTKIDVREFSSNMSLIIKVYSDNTKDTFKLGYKVLDLAPVSTDTSTPTSDFIQRGAVLEGEVGFCTTINAIL